MAKVKSQLIHDINSQLSALMSTLDLVRDEWKENPQLVRKVMPMLEDKLHEIQTNLELFYNENKKEE